MFFKYNKKTLLQKIEYWVLPVLSITLLLWLYTRAVAGNPVILPTFREIWDRFLFLMVHKVKGANLMMHVAKSLGRVFVGAVASWILGILFGVAIGWNRILDAIFGTLYRIMMPIPGVAWIPLIIYLFGVGEFPKYVLVFIGCFIGMTSQTYAGIKYVEKQYIDVGRLFGANRTQLLLHFVIPTALPSIFVGIQGSVGSGWKIILASEMMGAALGIGAQVMKSWNELDMAGVMVCVIIIAITGALLAGLVRFVERRLTPWQN